MASELREVWVWYDSPEAVNAAYVRHLSEACGDSLEGATMGGVDADGNEVEFTAEQMIEGQRAQGMWGFCDGVRIHAWIAADADEARAVHFMAHELAHLRGADAPPIAAEEEAWAELVGSIAAEAVLVLRSRRLLPLLTPDAQRVLEAAAKFEEAKEAARVCWVELGRVTPSIISTLDKATDNMLSAVRAWRASLETAVPTGSVPVPPVPQEDR